MLHWLVRFRNCIVSHSSPIERLGLHPTMKNNTVYALASSEKWSAWCKTISDLYAFQRIDSIPNRKHATKAFLRHESHTTLDFVILSSIVIGVRVPWCFCQFSIWCAHAYCVVYAVCVLCTACCVCDSFGESNRIANMRSLGILLKRVTVAYLN